MVSATGVSLSFGDQVVLDDLNVTLDQRSRAGLVGANGSGKTSLLRILAGRSTPDSGTISIARTCTLAYLPQQLELPPERTVLEVAQEGYHREDTLLRERHRLARELEDDPHNHNLPGEVATLDQSLENSGYYTRHAQIHRVLRGLGFSEEDLEQPIRTFSGGWAMRVVLARTLLERPDFLLLDEPTNYLDSESRLWLSRFLASFRGGYLLVSHDRAFLDDTTEETFEIFQGRLKRYRGTFTQYETQRRAELEQLIKRWEEQQKEIARQEQFIRRFRAQATKARQVQSRVKMLEKVEPVEIPEHLRPISISLPDPPHCGRHVLQVEELSRRYGSRHVLNKLTFTIERGRRLAVVGRNGAGKTTLLRILAGGDRNHDGTISLGSGVRCGYFAQDSPEQLPTDTTVQAYLESHAGDESRPMVRHLLGAFLFSGDAVEKPLEVLSGGERSRLAMASLLVRPLNLLILDEPTNHLDMTSQEVLARALQRYKGTVVFVSHDRSFLRSVATDVLALWAWDASFPDRWRLYPGSFQEFEESHIGSVFADPEQESRETTGSTANVEGARRYEEQKARKAEFQRLRRREAEMLEQIEAREAEHRHVQEELATPDIYTDGEKVRFLNDKLNRLQGEIDDLHRTWEETELRLAQLDV